MQLEKSERSATLESCKEFSMDYSENMSFSYIAFCLFVCLFICLFVLNNKWNNLCGEKTEKKNKFSNFPLLITGVK